MATKAFAPATTTTASRQVEALTPADLPEFSEPAQTLEEIANGAPLRFTVGGEKYQLRAPTPEEKAEAENAQTAARLLRSFDPEVAQLAQLPATAEQNAGLLELRDLYEKVLHSEQGQTILSKEQKRYIDGIINSLYEQLERRTAAEPLLDSYSARRRNIWLARHLLQDQDGRALDFNAIGIAAQEAAIDEAGRLLRDYSLLPFELVLQLGRLSSSIDTSSDGPNPTADA